MRIPVPTAAEALEGRGLLDRWPADHGDRIVERMVELLGRRLPRDLKDFYRARIRRVAGFDALAPVWNDHVGWRPDAFPLTGLMHASAVPLFWDGCGNLYGLDLSAGSEQTPGVYFFDHEDGYAEPKWAAGSSLGAFLLLLGEQDQAYEEGRQPGWELALDPDIDSCPRAPAVWRAG